MESVIQLKDISKTYTMGEVEVDAVKDVNMEINSGELVVILGASGAGKTTVLNLLGGMDRETSGQIIVEGNDITAYKQRKLTNYRRNKIGFVFQFYNLISNLNALENVEFAADVCEGHFDSKEVMERVGLQDRLYNFPSQLSGGEQQRVAIARAIAKNPLLLLCDEPTGALDYETSKQVLELLTDINKQYQKTVIIITHNAAIAEISDKIIEMKSGRIERVVMNPDKKTVKEIEW
ncbi:MAG TPA: ABC transporter ATP-binding protein [Candidatus Dormibacteraeota bacterium]|nr:ABC transporter ATP-binding protein [Candidatus Dormibacteraeota bacterium]